MIGESVMATKGSILVLTRHTHTHRKLKGRGGKIAHATKQTGVADGLTVVSFAHGLAMRFTTGMVTSRY